MNYILIIIVTLLLIGFMYINNIRQTNRDLKRQKQNLQTKIVQEKVQNNIQEFQAYQKAKKEQIKKDINENEKEVNENNKSDINLSVGTHDIDF